MKHKTLLGVGTLIGATLMAIAKEPTVMTVNGVDVPKSEFEYLYKKNNQQQMNPQSLEDYIELFKVYKLKVADAKSMGLDTAENFRREMEQYRRELANPFITDSLFIQQLIEDSYAHSQEEVEVSFIKLAKSRNMAENSAIKNKADSLRNILVDGVDFAETAKTYSQDIAADKGGYHGYMTVGRIPYVFEEALYNVPEGGVSEVIELGDAYYILKTGKRRPSRGKVEASHILKLVPQNASEEQKSQIKASIDSIYAVIIESPFKFGELAKKLSDDKASGRMEGRLPAFGSGEMVPEFEEVAFALPENMVSEPFESKFGWHIIKKHKNIPLQSKDEFYAEAEKKISNPQDARFRIVKEHEMKSLIKKHNGSLNEDVINELKRTIPQAGLDSLYLANWTTMPDSYKEVGEVEGRKVTAKDVVEPIARYKGVPVSTLVEIIDRSAENALANQAMEIEMEQLYITEPEYRNLLDEYTEGSLLYEASLIKVWDKAAKDEEGLNNYYLANRPKYKWEKPHAKGLLVQTANDSISAILKERLNNWDGKDESLLQLRKEFSGKAMFERVVAEEGVNPMVDNIMFNGQKVKPKIVNYTDYFIFNPRIVEQPEEMTDVKSQVTIDYQEQLEKDWIKDLESKYPVVINYEEIMTVK